MIVFCSDSHTAKGHVSIGNSAERLLEGGTAAIAIAPAGLAERADGAAASADRRGRRRRRRRARDRAGARGALGASVAPVANDETDLLVIDSRAEAEPGRVSLSSSAAHLIEIATLPGARAARAASRLPFARATAAAAA